MPEAEIHPDATAFDMPRHVAIIMDGNGRWAATRGLPRAEGHRRGVEALRRTVRAAGEMGIKILTIFSFSAENWSRPASEIGELMGLLRRFVRNDLAELHQNNIRVRVIGERACHELPLLLGLEVETLLRRRSLVAEVPRRELREEGVRLRGPGRVESGCPPPQRGSSWSRDRRPSTSSCH